MKSTSIILLVLGLAGVILIDYRWYEGWAGPMVLVQNTSTNQQSAKPEKLDSYCLEEESQEAEEYEDPTEHGG